MAQAILFSNNSFKRPSAMKFRTPILITIISVALIFSYLIYMRSSNQNKADSLALDPVQKMSIVVKEGLLQNDKDLLRALITDNISIDDLENSHNKFAVFVAEYQGYIQYETTLLADNRLSNTLDLFTTDGSVRKLTVFYVNKSGELKLDGLELSNPYDPLPGESN